PDYCRHYDSIFWAGRKFEDGVYARPGGKMASCKQGRQDYDQQIASWKVYPYNQKAEWRCGIPVHVPGYLFRDTAPLVQHLAILYLVGVDYRQPAVASIQAKDQDTPTAEFTAADQSR